MKKHMIYTVWIHHHGHRLILLICGRLKLIATSLIHVKALSLSLSLEGERVRDLIWCNEPYCAIGVLNSTSYTMGDD